VSSSFGKEGVIQQYESNCSTGDGNSKDCYVEGKGIRHPTLVADQTDSGL
jgi:hypothetical protein